MTLSLCYILAAILAQHGLATEFPESPGPTDSPQQPVSDLYFGDMKLTDEQKEDLKAGRDMGVGDQNNYAVVKGKNLRWPGAVIPYEIDCSLVNMKSQVQSIHDAMAEWENKTCIRFVKHTNEPIRLRFFRNTHCWGNVGYVSYSRISLGYACGYQHVMAHEIGHVVGFHHEQNRLDRDDWVNVHWENIGHFKDAFDKVQNTDSLGVDYDYESIMHYPWNAFSSNGKITMSPKKPTNGKVPYVGISPADVEQTSRMYNCPKIEKQRARSRSRRHIGQIEKSDASAYGKCTDNNQYCSDWARAGHCTLSDYVRENCKLSCRAPGCDLVCKDTYDDCEAWKNMGHCFVESVKQACPKSCNPACQGGNPPTQRPMTEKPKTDGPVRTDKPVTDGPQPTRGPNPTAIPRKTANGTILGIGKLCLDKKAKCKEWADRGDCISNPRYMLFYCAKSCKSKSCDMEIPRPPGECANPLGLSWDGTSNFKIPDSAFSSPTHLAPGGGWQASAQNARLYFEDDYTNKRIGCWCSHSHDTAKDERTAHVQVDLGSVKTINYIATQGRDKYYERVERYKVAYSVDGRRFQYYQENGRDKIFNGNCDHFSPVLNQFKNSIRARYIRYRPWNWNFPCVRMEFYGC